MRVESGYYTYNIASDRDDILRDELVESKKIQLVSSVLYQNGEMVWELFYVPTAFELGILDSVSWPLLFIPALNGAETLPEDGLTKEELEAGGFPEAEWLDENVVKPVEEFKRSFPSTQFVVGAVTITAIIIIISNLRKR